MGHFIPFPVNQHNTSSFPSLFQGFYRVASQLGFITSPQTLICALLSFENDTLRFPDDSAFSPCQPAPKLAESGNLHALVLP